MASVEQPVADFIDARLVADIGGTHCSFGIVLSPKQAQPQGVQWIQKLRVADYPNIVAAVKSYLTTITKQNDQPNINIHQACFAVATLVKGDQIAFTNNSWSFSIQQVQTALGLDRLQVLNDFAALALSLPNLTANDMRMVSNHSSDAIKRDGTLAVVGPGTGLGVGGLVQVDQRWIALSSEGGHVSLASADPFESEIIQTVRNQYPHVSAERLLSGIGMPLLYRSVALLNGAKVSELTSPEIIALGLTKSDAIADQTLDIFCAMLGGFCGNVVLTLGASSGLFIGGGIVPRLGERFFESAFLRRFVAKGRYESFLTTVPIALISHPYPALNGCALAIEQA